MFLLTFFKGITLKQLLYAAGAAALAAFIYFSATFVNDKYEADREIDRLELQIDTYEDTIRVMERVAEQKDRALEAADAARAELEALRPTYEEIWRNAITSTKEEDGEISPILRGTLDALDGLR
jgi:hypothetical protein